MQDSEASHDLTGVSGDSRRLGQRFKPSVRILLAVECDKAGAHSGQTFRHWIPKLARGIDCLAEVPSRRVMVTTLGGVPHELSHQRRGRCFDCQQLTAYVGSASLRSQERRRAKTLTGTRQQRCRRRTVVPHVKVLNALPQMRDHDQIHAARVAHDMVQPVIRLGRSRFGRCDQLSQLVDAGLQCGCETWAKAWLWLGLPTFPAHHCRPVHLQALRKILLTEADRLPALG